MFHLVTNLIHKAVWQMTLQWRNNERHGISNHRRVDCLLSRLFRRKSKKTPRPRVNDLCARNSAVTGELPAQKASNAETISIWWRHHDQSASYITVSDILRHLCLDIKSWPFQLCYRCNFHRWSMVLARYGCLAMSMINTPWIDISRSQIFCSHVLLTTDVLKYPSIAQQWRYMKATANYFFMVTVCSTACSG